MSRDATSEELAKVLEHTKAELREVTIDRDLLRGQIEKLANFIMANFREPSQNQGAVDTAIRLLARLPKETA